MMSKFGFLNSLRRRTLMVLAVVALVATMLPAAVFAAPASKTILVPNRDHYAAPHIQRHNNRYGDDNDKYEYQYDKDPRYNRQQKRHGGNYDGGNYDGGNYDGGNYDGGNYDGGNHDGGHNNYCDTTYKVRKGDTLSSISKHYHVSIYQLSKANGIKNPNRIYVGQRLCIP